jgi:hypothetical protein
MTHWPPFQMNDELSPKLKLFYARRRITLVQQVLWVLPHVPIDAKATLSLEMLAEVLAEAIYGIATV